MPKLNNAYLNRIVGKQLHTWTLRDDAARRLERSIAARANFVGPYLSISRLPHCHGEEVARHCAEALDWQFFDREIVDFIARNAGTLTQFVDSLDEQCRRAMDDWIQTALDSASMGHLTYLRHLKRVLLTIAVHGEAVILGRGANFILPPRRGLRVLLTSTWRMRLTRVMASESLERAEAERHLKSLDEKRRLFLKTQFKVSDPQAPEHYDLVLNMDGITIPEAVALIEAGILNFLKRWEDANPPRFSQANA